MAMTARAAIEKATKTLAEFFPIVEGTRLEEVRKSDDEKKWVVTLSFLFRVAPEESGEPLIRAMSSLAKRERTYKDFVVDAEDPGADVQMLIRNV